MRPALSPELLEACVMVRSPVVGVVVSPGKPPAPVVVGRDGVGVVVSTASVVVVAGRRVVVVDGRLEPDPPVVAVRPEPDVVGVVGGTPVVGLLGDVVVGSAWVVVGAGGLVVVVGSRTTSCASAGANAVPIRTTVTRQTTAAARWRTPTQGMVGAARYRW